MKDGVEGVWKANSAANGGTNNHHDGKANGHHDGKTNGNHDAKTNGNHDAKTNGNCQQQGEESPETLLAVGAEEVTAGDNALPLGGTLTNQNGVSPDTNGDKSGGKGSDGKSDKVFVCGICNRCFGYRHVLQNHERTHSGEKPFECPECHKRFTRDHHLKTHIRLHTGERPYQCSYCDRNFAQVANLRRHQRTHTGERPYGCEICTSRFSDSNQLKSHMLIHRGEKPFQCTECLGRFRRRHHLNHHKCPKDKNNIGKPRRGRRPSAYDPLPRTGEDDDFIIPDSIITDVEEDVLDRSSSHSSPEAERPQNPPTIGNGRPNHAIRILTPQQREIFLSDKMSMQTQAIDMRVSSETPLRTVIVPRFVEGVLDLSNSRSDSEIEPIDEEVNGEDEHMVDVVNGDMDHEDECRAIHQVRTVRAFTIRRTDPPPTTVIINHRRPTVLVGKMVEPLQNGHCSTNGPLNGNCSTNGHGLDHHQMNGSGPHYNGEEDQRKSAMSPPIPLTKKTSIVTA